MIGNNHCGNSCRDEFERRSDLHNVLCRQYYEERVVDIFTQKIQSEYYGGN